MLDMHYMLREKQYLLNRSLENKIKILESKVRFINEVIMIPLLFIRKLKPILLTNFIIKNIYFIKIILLLMTKDADISKINNDYDYLIKMPLYSLSQDKIDELEKELDTNKKEHATVFSKSIEDMWLEELDILKQKLKRFFI